MSSSTSASATELAAARYGKDKVRVFRIVRGEGGVHDIVEYEVCALVEGDIATRCVCRAVGHCLLCVIHGES